MVRIGVIGCGKISSTHCEAIGGVEGAHLVAVYDVSVDAASRAAEKYGVVAAESFDDLFDRVDAVTVCVPSGHHAEVAITAASAGKHALVEKPIEVNREAASRMVSMFRRAGLKLGVVSQHRFSKQMQRAHEAAESGEFGRLLEGDAYIKWYRTQAYYDSGDWRGTWELDGGGCLINQGVHYIDMIQWVMGGVRSVQAQVRTAAHDIEVEDVAMALVEYKNGAVGVIQASTSLYPGFAERFEVHGTHGSAIIEGDRTKLWEIDPEAAGQGLYGGGVMMQPTPSRHMHEMQPSQDADKSAEWGEQHRLQIEDFVRSIVDDSQPRMTGEMALEPLKIILSIYESARKGGARIEVA